MPFQYLTSDPNKLTQDCTATVDGWFSCIHQVEPMCPPTLAPPGEYDWTGASFGPPESTTQMANWSVQSFLHSSRQKVSTLYNRWLFPAKFPLLMAGSGPHLTDDSLGQSEPTMQTASRLVQLFSHSDHRVSLYFTMADSFPQNCPSHPGIWTSI